MQSLVITNAGKELAAKLIAGTTTATFTKVLTSDQDYSAADLKTLTELTNVRQTVPVSDVVQIDRSTVEVLAAMDNSKLTSGYFIRALGVIAEDGDGTEVLFAVSIETVHPSYLPAFAGKTVSSITYHLKIKVDNSEQVTIEINPGAYVTVEQLQTARNELSEAIVDLKKFVSDGKIAVANAITDKGIDTATDASFAIMAENIGNIQTGGLNIYTQIQEPKGKDGVWVQTENPYKSIVVGDLNFSNADDDIDHGEDGIWKSVSALPYGFAYGAAVVYENELHLMGGADFEKNHYKWNGSEWIEVGSLPYEVYKSAAVVYKNEIHLMGGIYGATQHWKWNGSEWIELDSLPCDTNYSMVYENEIHIFKRDKLNSHYKFNGLAWEYVGELPKLFQMGFVVAHKNEIHLMAKTSYESYHYKFTKTKWEEIGELPYDFSYSVGVVYNDEIHVIAGYNTNPNEAEHYKWNDDGWQMVSTLPFGFYNGAAIIYKNELCVLGSASGKGYFQSMYFAKTHSANIGSKVVLCENSSNDPSTYTTKFLKNVAITADNNKFPFGFDDVYYIDEDDNIEPAPTYYGDGTRWVKFKN